MNQEHPRQPEPTAPRGTSKSYEDRQMFEKQQPTVTPLSGPMEGERYQHPAYGTISLMNGTCGHGGLELFGSDLNHRSVLTITLSTAHLDRHLNRDWVHSERDVVSFHMSEAQWAAFISSQGGAAEPITFERRPDDAAPVQVVSGIESPETMMEQFDREIRERCAKYMETATSLLEGLGKALEDGKANKGTLKELRDLASNLSNGMPNSMAFVQKQMATAMEKTVSAGKIELEAYVNDMATRTGLEALRNQSVTLIEHSRKSENPTE